MQYQVGDLLTRDYSDSVFLVIQCQEPVSKFVRTMIVLCLNTQVQEEILYHPKSNGFNLFERIYGK